MEVDMIVMMVTKVLSLCCGGHGVKSDLQIGNKNEVYIENIFPDFIYILAWGKWIW